MNPHALQLPWLYTRGPTPELGGIEEPGFAPPIAKPGMDGTLTIPCYVHDIALRARSTRAEQHKTDVTPTATAWNPNYGAKEYLGEPGILHHTTPYGDRLIIYYIDVPQTAQVAWSKCFQETRALRKKFTWGFSQTHGSNWQRVME